MALDFYHWSSSMDISVMLERIANNGFRAVSFTPDLVAVGRTREEALEELRAQIQERLTSAEFIQLRIPVPGEAHPWKQLRGSWAKHPDAEQIERNMREYREQVNADSDRL